MHNNFNNFNSNDDYNYKGNNDYNKNNDYIYNEYNNSYYKRDKRCNISNIKKVVTTTVAGLLLTVTTVNFLSNKTEITEESEEVSLASFELEVSDNNLEPKLPEYKTTDNISSYTNARLISETEVKANQILESNITNEKARIKQEEEKVKAAAANKNKNKTYSSKTKYTASFNNSGNANGSFASFGGNSVYQLSESERSLLERLLAAEARGEDYTGQLAVASVLANRIESGAFPNSVQGVIYQKSQFSPVSNGKINSVKVNGTQKQVISDVFDKGIRNVPRDVLYFCYPEISSSKWMINTKKKYGRHGVHAFFYK